MFSELNNGVSRLDPFIKDNDNIVWYNSGFYLDPIIIDKKKSNQYWYETDPEYFNFLKVIQSEPHFYQLLKTCINLDVTDHQIVTSHFMTGLPFEYFLLSVPRALDFMIVNNNLLFGDQFNNDKWNAAVKLLPIIRAKIRYKYILRDNFPHILPKFNKNFCLFLINLKNFGNILTDLEYNLGITSLEELRTCNHNVLISLDSSTDLQQFKDWNINELESEIVVTNYENN